MTISGIAISSRAASAGARTNRMIEQAMPMTMLRKATEMVVPTVCSMMVVSAVIRLAISAGRFSSKKPGARRSKLRWTARRMSATTRSPIQLTK